MDDYAIIKKSPFLKIGHGLNKENLSDHKVAFLKEVDMSSAMRVRQQAKALGNAAPTYTALLAKAISIAFVEQPHANRVWLGLPFFKRLVQLKRVDITVAVERDSPGFEQAVFAGTIRDTDKKDLGDITAELRGLANATPESCPRWRQFKSIVERLPAFLALPILRIPKLSAKLWIQHRGGAVMISSPAKYGADAVIGAWPWPLGFSFGFVKERPIVVDGEVVARPTMPVTFSFDRRLMAGAPSARFFERVCVLIATAEESLVGHADDGAADGVGGEVEQPAIVDGAMMSSGNTTLTRQAG